MVFPRRFEVTPQILSWEFFIVIRTLAIETLFMKIYFSLHTFSKCRLLYWKKSLQSFLELILILKS